ncbi:MAG: DUF523 domain-containing protein [Bacteroidota bacterium]
MKKPGKTDKFVVSACLAGKPCRYDGGTFDFPSIRSLVEQGLAVPVCPEELGGLPTPRIPSEIVDGDGRDVLDEKARVLSQEGGDVTDAFLRGAREALRIAREAGATEAILKAKSPSCGRKLIHDGHFQGGLVEGMGVTAALFEREGIPVRDEDSI